MYVRLASFRYEKAQIQKQLLWNTEILYLDFRNQRTTQHSKATWKHARNSPEADGARRKHEQRPVLWLLQGGTGGRISRVDRFRIGHFEQLCRLWGVRTAPRSQVSGHVMMRKWKYCLQSVRAREKRWLKSGLLLIFIWEKKKDPPGQIFWCL